MAKQLSAQLPGIALPSSWAPATSVGIEIGGGIALLFRRTRPVALCGLFLFHVALARVGHAAFSCFAFAMLALFLPERLRGSVPRRVAAVGRHPASFVALAAAYVGLHAVDRYRIAGTILWALVHVEMLAFGILLLATALRPSKEPGFLRLAGAGLLVGPILVVATSLAPFLGLKTEAAFSMYSNLRTEGEAWNHYLYPRAMRVFPYQDELVTILASSDPRLKKAAARGEQWVYFEFRRYLARRPDASVAFERAGRRTRVARVGDDPLLSTPPGTVWERKLLWFRPVRPPRDGEIEH